MQILISTTRVNVDFVEQLTLASAERWELNLSLYNIVMEEILFTCFWYLRFSR